jgi:peptidoglycan/xylan/chitin deacetylase (PgdA/CDA1 family)
VDLEHPLWRRLHAADRRLAALPLVPILLYHSISDAPPAVGRDFTVDPASFGLHLDLIAQRRLEPLTVSDFVETVRRRDERRLARAVVITFDDGFRDFATAALPALRDRGLTATLYVTTGVLRGGPEPPADPVLAEHMLDWAELAGLRGAGIEIGAHSHTHPQLDTLAPRAARREIAGSKALLERSLGEPVRSFAYPHGYSSRRVRRLVQQAGYESACAVKDTLSSAEDDRFALSRLMVRSSTAPDEIGRWLDRLGAAPRAREAMRTRAWRGYRRGRALLTRRPGADPEWRMVRR